MAKKLTLGKTVASVLITSTLALSVAIGITVGQAYKANNESGQNGEGGNQANPFENVEASKVEKTGSYGLIDEYTIEFDDGTESRFIVVKNSDGKYDFQAFPNNEGHTPTVALGENGNWIINEKDTGFLADITNVIDDYGPYVGPNGNWWIGDVDTGAIARGEDGLTPFIGDNGNWWIGENDTGVPAQGQAGQNGVTPHIGDNGNWFIGETDTGIPASGNNSSSIVTGHGNPNGDNSDPNNPIAPKPGNVGDTFIDLDSGTIYIKDENGWQVDADGASGLQGTTPHIGDNGNWWIGEQDTGVPAQGQAGQNGITPHIGENGHWWIGEQDTGVAAQGQNGVTPHVGDNGNWWIGEQDTGVPAQGQTGQNGVTPHIGDNGNWFIGEQDTGVAAQGQNGQNGVTPHIGANCNWWIGEQDTGIAAQGAQGLSGRSVVSIEKTDGTGAPGTVDTYTITYSDNTTSIFYVSNGADGASGAQGVPGENGHTPVITINEEGYWVIDGVATTVLAKGQSVFVGSGEPAANQGNIGDTYINLENGDTYVKTEAGWGNPTGDSGFAMPSIGANGNWYIGTQDTGVHAQGTSILAGTTAPNEAQGNVGDTYLDATTGNFYVKTGTGWGDPIGNLKGADGRSVLTVERTAGTGAAGTTDTYTITYSDNTSSTFEVTNGANGNTLLTGTVAPENEQGVDGDSYLNVTDWSYYIKESGAWASKGSIRGDDGVSITSITFDHSEGHVDTYVITYSDSNTTTFTVTNGNTVITGSADPVDQGANGDSYINTTSWEYFVKENDAWVSKGHINGADGTSFKVGYGDPNGDDSDPLNVIEPTEGIEGDSYLNLADGDDKWNVYVYDGTTWNFVGNIHNIPTVFHITFNTDSASANSDEQEVQAGYGLEKPENPTKDGYFFQGWYTPEGHRWNFEKDTPTKDMELTARWATFKVENSILVGCTETGAVVIPTFFDDQVVTGIDPDVFKGNTSITSITIPSTIQSIPDSAFEGCTNLKEVYLPDGLQSIGEKAFKDCESLDSVVIPYSVKNIGNRAFSGCTQLKYIYLSDTQVGYFTFDGSRAPMIGLYIGDYAFENCIQIKSLIIPSKVNHIGFGAFKGCEIEYLSIPSMEYAGDIYKGNGAPSSDIDACETDYYLDVDTGDLYYYFDDEWEIDGTYDYFGVGTPDPNVGDDWEEYVDCETLMTYYKFEGVWEEGRSLIDSSKNHDLNFIFGYEPITSLTTLDINSGERIYDFAYNHLDTVKTITIADSIRYIDYGAFQYCIALETVSLPNRLLTLGETAFYNNTSLRSINIPGSLATISQSSFQSCSNLEKVILNEGLENIGTMAFAKTNLKSLVLPNSLKTIGSCAFQECYNLAAVYFNDGLESVGQFSFNRTAITNVVLPDSLTYIGVGAFCDCNLVTITLPAVWVSDVNEASYPGEDTFGKIFARGAPLEPLVIPTSLKTVVITGDHAIAEDSFIECSGIESLVFSGKPSSMAKGCLQGCSGLKTLVLPYIGSTYGISYVYGDGAPTDENTANIYFDCTNKVLYLNNDGQWEVDSNYDFTGYEFGAGAPTNTSANNHDLYLDYESGISYIFQSDDLAWLEYGDFCFDNQPEDTYFAYLFGADTFNGNPTYNANVPASLKTVILNNATTVVTPAGSYQYVDKNAFTYCVNIETINIPNGTRYIGEQAFAACEGLKNINIPDTLEIIQSTAFAQCSSIESLVLPNSIKKLGDWSTFIQCTSLKTITLPNSIEMIGTMYFGGCSSLESIIIPKTVRFIDDYAFDGCTSLKYVAFEEGSVLEYINPCAFRNCSDLVGFVVPNDSCMVCRSVFMGCTSLESLVLAEVPYDAAILGISTHEGAPVNGYTTPGYLQDRYWFDTTTGDWYARYVDYDYDAWEYLEPDDWFLVTNLYDDPSVNKTYYQISPEPSNPSEGDIWLGYQSTNRGYRVYRNGNWVEIDASQLWYKYLGFAFGGKDNSSVPASLKTVVIKNGNNNYIESFKGCSHLETVVIGNGTMTIGRSAFEGCTNLKNVTIPNGVTNIGLYAFKDCVELELVSLPNSVTTIGYAAFAGTFDEEWSLSSYTLDEILFKSCITPLAQNIYVSADEPTSAQDSDVFIDTDDGMIYFYYVDPINYWNNTWNPAGMYLDFFGFEFGNGAPDSSVGSLLYLDIDTLEVYEHHLDSKLETLALPFIGESTESADQYFGYIFGANDPFVQHQFVPSSLKTVILGGGNGVDGNEIPEMAFMGCSYIENIVIPNSITSINDLAFARTGIKNFDASNYAISHLGYAVFDGCTNLAHANFGNNSTFTVIDDYTFALCSSLEEFLIPDSVTEIWYYTFKGCSSLESIFISNKISLIDYYAFEDCFNIKYVFFEKDSTLEFIGNYAFAGCSSLENIVIPDSVTELGQGVFMGGVEWTSVPVANLREMSYMDDSYILIFCDGDLPYDGDYNDKYRLFNMSNGGMYLWYPFSATYTDWDCRWFTPYTSSNTLFAEGPLNPDAVDTSYEYYIDKLTGDVYATKPGGKLTSITLPFVGDMRDGGSNEYLTYLFGSLTYDQDQVELFVPSPESLKTVILTGGNGVDGDTIPDYAFAGCKHLENVYFPSEVNIIGKYAFQSCESISSSVLHEGIITIDDWAFHKCKHFTRIVVPESVTTIGIGAFNECTSLETIVLPFVGDQREGSYQYFSYIFGCSYICDYWGIPDSLREVIVTGGNGPDGDEVPISAFYHCENLTTISVPSTIKTIGNGAFGYCYGLTSIVIPDCVTTIGEFAYENCTNATYIYFNGALETIGDYAFNGMEKLKIAIVPDYVNEIGNFAFKDCTSLEAITLPFIGGSRTGSGESQKLNYVFNGNTMDPANFYPSSLRNVVLTGLNGDGRDEIPDYAFKDNDLTSVRVTLPAHYKTIGQYAFYETTMDSLDMSIDVTTIGAYAFSKSTIKYVRFSESLTTIGSCAFLESNIISVVLPDTIANIDSSAFSSCTRLTYAYLGQSITSISGSLFYNCGSLKAIAIPDSVTAVEGGAFAHCSSLKTVSFGNNVQTIGDNAFQYCALLESLTLPDSLESLGVAPFQNCNNIKTLSIPFVGKTRTTTNSSEMKLSYMFGWSSVGSATAIETIVIRHGSGASGDIIRGLNSSEKLANLKTVILPDDGTITEIGSSAFDGLSSLKYVNIPDSVTKISNYAFNNCTNLELTTFNGVNVTTIGQCAFAKCEKLTNVYLPVITSIGQRAFEYCTHLETFDIPQDTVLTIGERAFLHCSSLKSIILSGTTTMASSSSLFEGCYGLETLGVPYINGDIQTFFNYSCPSHLKNVLITGDAAIPLGAIEGPSINISEIETIIVSGSPTSIAQGAFRGGLTSLKTLVLPYVGSDASTPKILGYLFNSLTEDNANVPASLRVLEINGGIIGDDTFKDVSGLEVIALSDSITTVGNSAFSGCTNLKSIHLPNSIAQIGNNTFYECVSLTNVDIPDTVASIGSFAFYNCSSLVSVNIPDGVPAISESAFQNCSSLQSIAFSGNASTHLTIGMRAFFNCTALKTVDFDKEMTVDSLGYFAFSGCSRLYSFNQGRALIIEVEQNAFKGCVSLETIKFKEGLTRLGDSAFEDCESLMNVILPEGLDTIYSYTFSGCTSLTNVVIPSTVTVIDNNAFEQCVSLTSTLNLKNVKTIRESAFEGCANISTVIIDVSELTTLQDNAFKGCDGITTVVVYGASGANLGAMLTTYEAWFGNNNISSIGNEAIAYISAGSGNATSGARFIFR